MLHRLQFAAHLGRKFAYGERASVAISGALALPALLGVAGLALEYGDTLVTRAEAQRVADLAVYAGIMAINRGGDAAAATQAARNVVRLNGMAPDDAFAVFDQNSADGPVGRVTITTPRPLVLSQFISLKQSLNVTVRSAAILDQAQPGCVQALDPSGTGITLSGGTSITTSGCAVSSNSTVDASGGATIVTETLSYDSATPPSFSGSASITAPDGGAARIVRSSVTDPMANHPGVALATARMGMVAAMQSPQMPLVSAGPNIDFGTNVVATQQQAAAIGCTASFSGSTWTFSCPANATVNLGNLTIGGGLNLDFGLGGGADTTYSFSGSIRNTGTIMRFGQGTYNIAGGIFTGGGTTTQFAAGTYRIGRASSTCSNSDRYSICNTATISFGGPSAFELAGGVYNDGSGSVTLGSGQGNSFRIGPSANGHAFQLGGGSNTVLADATGANGKFELVGNTRTGGNSCFVVGAAANHDIAGHFDLSGGAILGSGLYTIDGYLHLGASSGGSSACQGENISLRAIGVTFNFSGKGVVVRNFNCGGYAAFCAGSGYSGMQITPPSSGPFANLAVLGPLSPSVNAGALFHAGASGGQIAGAFYFPNGPISLSGGASASGAAAGCLQMIGSSVTLSGGTSIASECVLSDSVAVAHVRIIE